MTWTVSSSQTLEPKWLYTKCCLGEPGRGTPLYAVDKDGGTDSEEALTGEYSWTIENFSKIKQLKLYSPVFQSGQYNWCAQHSLVLCLYAI